VNSLNTRLTLIARVRDADDSQAWSEFVTIYTPIIFSFLRKRGLSPTDAEDVTQDTFHAISQALPKFNLDKSIGTFRNWLFTVTRSKLNTHLSKSQRTDIPTGNLPESADTKDWDELYMKELFAQACRVVEKQVESSTWHAFWRTAVELESPDAVATALSLTTDNVYQKKSRVAARIREAIQSLDETAI